MWQRYKNLPFLAILIMPSCSEPIVLGKKHEGTAVDGTPFSVQEIIKVSDAIPIYIGEKELKNKKYKYLTQFKDTYYPQKNNQPTNEEIASILRAAYYRHKLYGDAILLIRSERIAHHRIESTHDCYQYQATTILFEK